MQDIINELRTLADAPMGAWRTDDEKLFAMRAFIRDIASKIERQRFDVMIAIDGGSFIGARASVPMAIEVRDFDNIKGGDNDPMADYMDANGDISEEAWARAGFPVEIA